MNKTFGIQLIIYSLLLAGLNYVVHLLAPSLARPTLITGLIGGLICLIWGLRAVRGSRSKAGPVLTLIPINFILLLHHPLDALLPTALASAFLILLG